MINALRLLANQQEDGDGLLQNIVTNLGKGSRGGLTDGLRDFIKVDNHRALDVEIHTEATKTVESEWRLEPEGEAEVPEIIVVSDAVEGTFVDLGGESRHAQVEAKLLRRGREVLNEGEEIGSPKRKAIRVESE